MSSHEHVASEIEAGSLVHSTYPADEGAFAPACHADDIISTLEDLKTDFKNKKDELSQQESAAKRSE